MSDPYGFGEFEGTTEEERYARSRRYDPSYLRRKCPHGNTASLVGLANQNYPSSWRCYCQGERTFHEEELP